MKPQIAVYGGSFDPPHIGHTLAAAYVLSAYPVQSLVVVPTGVHPFDKPLSPFEHRLHMCSLAMADLHRVEVSAIEAELGGKSWTLRTLEALRARHPYAQLRLVIGSDLIAETGSWHEFGRIEQLAPPIVLARAGHPLPSADTEDTEDAPVLPEISSTELRRRLRAGESTAGLLNPEIARYALEHRLYR